MSDRILWRFVELGHPGQSLPRAVIKTVGEDPVTIAAAAWAVTGSRRIQRRAADSGPLAATQEDRLRFL